MAITLSQFNLLVPDAGSAASPTLGFQNSSNTGFFLKSDSVIGVSVGGTEVFNFSSSGGSEVGQLILGDGSVTAPSLAWGGSSSNTGLYLFATDSIGFSANGVACGNYSSAGVWTFPNQTLFTAATNQVVIQPAGGSAKKFIFTGTAPAVDTTLTIPDPGAASANIVLDKGAYTIAGALTLSAALAITPTTNQLVLGTTRTITISASQPATSSRVYTIPDQGAAANFLMSAAAQTVAGQQTFSAAPIMSAGITATATNDSAAAGIVGEVLAASRLKSAATGATSTTSLNVTSAALALTAGDWDVSGCIGFLPAGTTSITILKAAISKTTATLPASDTLGVPTAGEVTVQWSTAANVSGANDNTLQIPTTRISLASTTNIFLVANATFSVSTLTVYGSLNARRVR